MQRREFLSAAIGAAVMQTSSFTRAAVVEHLTDSKSTSSENEAGQEQSAAALAALKPMAVGLLIQPSQGPEATISRVKDLGFSNCFFSIDGYLGKYTPSLARQLSGLLDKNGVTATCAEVVQPGPLVWDFLEGPSTIGLVPRATRQARIDALKQTSDFAKLIGIPQVQTHCGFIPENPKDPFYEETVLAIRQVAQHCAGNGQNFLMETGQETPTTLLRAIKDVNVPTLGVGLDTANLILYGKANPVDAVEIIGRHVKSVHAKDGMWPTDPMKLGEEVLIGKGRVDFLRVFTRLHELGYRGAITIERETSGPQQIEDVKQEKIYLEQIIAQAQSATYRA
ncbi:MAG TPA: sugar phosphate isomerase/epimerase family protein [Acidisarcina sp.]|nr:sugar phosphate isomerase/epimerase family protein [Acidisarcina sp.]